MRRQLTRSTDRAGSSAPPDRALTPAFLWRAVCQWWKWVAPLGLVLSMAAGAIVWYLHVPMYEAEALVKIETEVPFIAFETGDFNHDGDRYVQTQIELLRGTVVLAPVLSRPEVAAIREIKEDFDPLKFLQKQLTVAQVGKSELYQVSYVSRSPQDAATVANLIIAEYLKMQDHEDKQRSRIVIDVLEKERLDRGVKVEQLRKRVVELAKELTGKDPFGQGVVTDVNAFSPAATLYQSLTESDVSLEVLKAELQALNEAPILTADKVTAAGLLDLEISNRLDVRQLEERSAVLHEEIADLKSQPRTKIGDTWEKDPEIQRLTERAEGAKAELEELKAAARKELVAFRLAQQQTEHQRLLAAKTQDLTSLAKKREMLTQKFDMHLQELKSGGAQSAELEFARAELDREQKVFELIAARKLALQTEMRAPARVSLMQSASVPTISLEPIPYKLLLLACLTALVAPLAVAVAQESIVQRITSPEQLTKESLLPVLGEVARFPMRRVSMTQQALPAAQQRERYVFAESIDSLRTNLMLTENLGVPGQKKGIAICSAASGEGKSSVAASLAVSIAEATQQPTLIMDADLRAPDIAAILGVPTHPGLAEVLCGKASLREAIHRVGDTQTFVMPAGIHRVNPHHIMQGSKIDALFEALHGKFSTIVIDTPPVLGASESLVYAKAADFVVFCSLADVSRAKQVRAAVARLHSTGANIAGSVLSGVSVGRYVYDYGSYVHRR
jgi:polysaccharide biosynthesis transport protein